MVYFVIPLKKNQNVATQLGSKYLHSKLDRKKIIAVIDTTFAVVKRKPEKNQACRVIGIRTCDLCDTGEALIAEVTGSNPVQT